MLEAAGVRGPARPGAAGKQPRLEFRGVSKSYLRRGAVQTVIQDVTLALQPGAFVALTGESGAGKTTLLELAAGLQQPSAGRVLVGGSDLRELGEARTAHLRLWNIGLLFRRHSLIPTLGAAENVALPVMLAGVPRRRALARAHRLLGRLGLEEKGGELPADLSQGERHLLGVARALVNDPKILLADEPTAGLDSVASDDVMRLLSELVEEDGLTVLLATHDARAAAYASEAHRLAAGRLERA